MNITELIEKIAGTLNIPESNQKLFFELLLKRCSEVLSPYESLAVPALGKFQYKKSLSENDLIVFITNDNEELQFDIPQKENENLPIDSYFSISIGKPVIPLKGSANQDLSGFIPHSDDEMKKLLELKVEKFIEDAGKTEIEKEEEPSDIADIQFSFLNWKKSSRLNEEIDQIEKGFDESSTENENKFEELTESKSLSQEETEIIEDKTSEVVAAEIKENNLSENIEEDVNEVEEINANKELIIEKPEDEDELMEATEEWVDDLIDESKNDEEKISEEEIVKEEEIPSYPDEKEKINISEDSSAINEAFKYADDKKIRIESYKKGSYTGIIFGVVIILATALIIYFSYYFSDGEETPVTVQNSEPKEFKVVIKRTLDIPVSYPYQSGMFAGIYNAIRDDILTPVISKESSLEQNSEITGNKKNPEIRSTIPAKRIKDYIYQYDDGTFAVQLSSWKSRAVALSETQKLIDNGFNAFIEETGLSGGTYYRVRVGGFKSLTEAEDFSKK